MNSLAFVTHPSVRIKGSENNYTPSLCVDDRCPIKAPHMHCPFCVKTDAYQDPVILKAHYRVKHVDKGIEFAGLKILRCCDHCDIVGIIKGEKRFKGAHWHCYRCRNGFNRRDEAIKHYKTHFRNPQTTFQIQITQDLNLPPGGKAGNHQHQEVINHQQTFSTSIENPIQDIIHPVLAQASLSDPNVINADGNVANDKYKKMKVKEEPLLQRGENHSGVSVDQGQTIMIIQGDNLESAFADHIISGGEVSVLDKNSVDPSLSWEIKYRMEEEEKNEYKARMEEYKNQVEVLQQRIQELEAQHPTSQLRVQDLLASLSLGDESKQQLAQQISKYLEELQSQEPDADLGSNQDVESQHQHLITSDGIINQLTNPTHNQADNVELTTDVRKSLAHQDLQSDSTVVAHLSQIGGQYQVIDSTDHSNHNHHNSEENPIPDSIENNDASNISGSGKTAHHDTDNIYSTSVTNISIEEATREAKDDMFQQVSASGSHNEHEIIVAQVVSSDSDHPNMISQKLFVDSSSISDACGNSRIINIDGTVDNNRLLQVVAASAQGDHGSGTFIMETENGQQIIIQRTEEPTDPEHHKLEPEPKRQRFLEEN